MFGLLSDFLTSTLKAFKSQPNLFCQQYYPAFVSWQKKENKLVWFDFNGLLTFTESGCPTKDLEGAGSPAAFHHKRICIQDVNFQRISDELFSIFLN